MAKEHIRRCSWAENTNALMQAYHDNEWGSPIHNDQKLFEMLSLELMQAGLSWQTILNKREAFREAFDDFDYNKVASYQSEDVTRLLANAQIIRNKRKINAIIQNAKCIQQLNTYQSFDDYIWFHGTTCLNDETQNTLALQKQLKSDGFQFIGPTILTAFLEAIGIYQHHDVQCDWHTADSNRYLKR